MIVFGKLSEICRNVAEDKPIEKFWYGNVVEGHRSEMDTWFLQAIAKLFVRVIEDDSSMQDSRKGDGVQFHQGEDVFGKDSMSNILVSGPRGIFCSSF